jgi:hypothetical protein
MIDNEKRRRIEGSIFLVLFCLTIPAANWMIGHIGAVCVPNGPCLLPVAPGIMAPSGVLMVGAALVLRDLVQRRLGVEFGIGAIVVGAMISAGLAPASLVIASTVAFLLSETSRSIPRLRDGGWWLRWLPPALPDSWSTRSCFSGSRSVQWSSCSVKSWVSSGWCCSRCRLLRCCAAATSGWD